MNTRNTLILIVLIAIVMALAGALLQPRMQTPLATYWNARGEADGFGGVFEALYLMPVILLASGLLILGLPRLDPMRSAKLNFPMLGSIVLLMALFLAYLHALTLAWNLGYRFNMNMMLVPGMGLMFFFLGKLIQKAQPNWFIGVRTPWTISSPVVWRKTHDLAGKLFMASGLIALLGVFFPNAAVWLLMVPVMVAAFGTVIYSYIAYRQLNGEG